MPKQPKSRAQKKNVDKASKEGNACCPVPIINCNAGEKANESDSVWMYCTNPACTVSKKPIHAVCFEKLEDSIVKSLKTSGSSRCWSEAQCRENLWGRRTRFVDKLLKCRCGSGQLYISQKDAMVYHQKTAAAKSKNQKERPKLIFNMDMSDKKQRKLTAKLESHYLSMHSDDEMLPEPNPKSKIATIKAKPPPPTEVNNNQRKYELNLLEPAHPTWMKDYLYKTPSPCPDELKQIAKDKLRTIQERKTSLMSTSPCSELSTKTSVDLGVWTDCSSSVDLNESESSDEQKCSASPEFFSDLIKIFDQAEITDRQCK